MRLPVLWWRDVPMDATEPVELSPLDQFMVEAASRRGRLTLEDFTLFTGLPERVFGGLARRLWNLGLVDWENGIVTPSKDAHRRIAEGDARRRRTITVDLLYLPHSDDLVVIEEGLSDFEQALPHTLSNGAPLPEHLLNSTRDGLLTDRITSGRVLNLPSGVLGPATVTPDEPVHAMAKSRRGGKRGADIPLVPTVECSLTLTFEGSDSSQSAGADETRAVMELRPSSRSRGNASVTLNLGAARGLAMQLRSVDRLLGAHQAALEALGIPSLTADRLEWKVPGRWSLPINGTEAKTLATSGSLTAPVGIEIQTETVHLLTSVEFRAADADARQRIAVDALLDTVLADPAHARKLATRERQADNAERDQVELRRRAWALSHYWVVHALREPEDFAYA